MRKFLVILNLINITTLSSIIPLHYQNNNVLAIDSTIDTSTTDASMETISSKNLVTNSQTSTSTDDASFLEKTNSSVELEHKMKFDSVSRFEKFYSNVVSAFKSAINFEKIINELKLILLLAVDKIKLKIKIREICLNSSRFEQSGFDLADYFKSDALTSTIVEFYMKSYIDNLDCFKLIKKSVDKHICDMISNGSFNPFVIDESFDFNFKSIISEMVCYFKEIKIDFWKMICCIIWNSNLNLNPSFFNHNLVSPIVDVSKLNLDLNSLFSEALNRTQVKKCLYLLLEGTIDFKKLALDLSKIWRVDVQKIQLSQW